MPPSWWRRWGGGARRETLLRPLKQAGPVGFPLLAIGLLAAICIVGLGAALLLTEAREREPAPGAVAA